MKNIIYIAILILFTGCGNFLDEYSQDLVVPKTVSDLNEVLLGNGYVPSSEVQYLRRGSIGWQLNILDDDINTVIAYVGKQRFAGNGSSLLWVHDLANGSGEKLHGK